VWGQYDTAEDAPEVHGSLGNRAWSSAACVSTKTKSCYVWDYAWLTGIEEVLRGGRVAVDAGTAIGLRTTGVAPSLALNGARLPDTR
jgi:hypothetical protein